VIVKRDASYAQPIEGQVCVVTGGAGLVGSHICDQLVEAGAREVRVIDNLTRGRVDNLEAAFASGRVHLIEGDIRDRELLARVFDGADLVFHQAAIRITRCAQEPRECLEVLVNGTFNVLEACVGAKMKKLVLASSASVYGPADVFPTDEMHHLYNNRTLYGAAKVANEQMARAFNEMYGLPYVALRYFNIYGPRMDVFGVYTEVLVRWLDKLEAGEAPLIYGDGKQTMDFVYIGDIARSNLLAARAPIADAVFNVASGEETSLRELCEAVLRVTGSSVPPTMIPMPSERRGVEVVRRLAGVANAQAELGFEAQVGIDEGLRRFVVWRDAEKRKAAQASAASQGGAS